MLGIALVALVGVLVSPVSWIHHLVWIVPVLAVLVGDATDRRRVRLAVVVAALFTLRLPYLGDNIPRGWHLGWIAAVLRDSYGLLCVFLLVTLARLAVDRRTDDRALDPGGLDPAAEHVGERVDDLAERRVRRAPRR